MTSDGRGRGASAKSDFILIKGGTNKSSDEEGGRGVKKGPKSSDVIYGRPLYDSN